MIALLTISFAGSLHAQQEEWKPSIDERSKAIIEKCIEAMGGEMALDAANTIELKGNAVRITSGTRFTSSDKYYLRRNAYRLLSSQSNGQSIESVDNGEFFWMVLDGNETHATIFETPIVPRDLIPWPGVVLEWENSNKKIRYLDSGKHKEQDVHTLEFERSDGALCHFHFSQKTDLLYAVEIKQFGGGMKYLSSYTFEYETTDGISLPLRQEMTQPHNSRSVEYEVVEFGGEIPNENFEMNDKLKQRWKEIQQTDMDKMP